MIRPIPRQVHTSRTRHVRHIWSLGTCGAIGALEPAREILGRPSSLTAAGPGGAPSVHGGKTGRRRFSQGVAVHGRPVCKNTQSYGWYCLGGQGYNGAMAGGGERGFPAPVLPLAVSTPSRCSRQARRSAGEKMHAAHEFRGMLGVWRYPPRNHEVKNAGGLRFLETTNSTNHTNGKRGFFIRGIRVIGGFKGSWFLTRCFYWIGGTLWLLDAHPGRMSRRSFS